MSYNQVDSGMDFSRPQASGATGMDFSHHSTPTQGMGGSAAVEMSGSMQAQQYVKVNGQSVAHAIPIHHVANVNDTNRYYVNQVDARLVQDGMIVTTATQQVNEDGLMFLNRVQQTNNNYNNDHQIAMIEGAHHFRTLIILSFVLAVLALVVLCIFLTLDHENVDDENNNDDTESDEEEDDDLTEEEVAIGWLNLISFIVVCYYFYKIYIVQHYEWRGRNVYYWVLLSWIIIGFVFIFTELGYRAEEDYETAYYIEATRLFVDCSFYSYSTIVFVRALRDSEREAVGMIIHPIE